MDIQADENMVPKGPCIACGRSFIILRTGPDGSHTLCSKCYKWYITMELPLFQSPDGFITARRPNDTPGWRVLLVVGFELHDTGIHTGQCNRCRPITVPLKRSGPLFPNDYFDSYPTARPREVHIVASVKHSAVCVACSRKVTSCRTGPDGLRTLCWKCYRKYTDLKLPVFQGPDGTITARWIVGWTKMRVTGFHTYKTTLNNGLCDRQKPITEPFIFAILADFDAVEDSILNDEDLFRFTPMPF